MHPDFLAIGLQGPSPAGRRFCVEVCAHSFYGKSWCVANERDFGIFVRGLDLLACGERPTIRSRFAAPGPFDGLTTISAAPLTGTPVIEIEVRMDYPEGWLRTSFSIPRPPVRAFCTELRTAWASVVPQVVELIGSV
ncbi:MAG: hypothetical protein KDC38_07710 [Planctomycetes bacterium]|nr:hypothetical protein [Planctomycetota bacterium]